MSADTPARLLYCHCQYAQVVPREVKEGVLRKLCEADVDFEAVADLCEMAARKDPALERLSGCGRLKIAACFPRAVKGLFHQAGSDLNLDTTEVLNMRTEPVESIVGRALAVDLQPNVPAGKETIQISAAS